MTPNLQNIIALIWVVMLWARRVWLQELMHFITSTHIKIILANPYLNLIFTRQLLTLPLHLPWECATDRNIKAP
jgi:hypothetical protein